MKPATLFRVTKLITGIASVVLLALLIASYLTNQDPLPSIFIMVAITGNIIAAASARTSERHARQLEQRNNP